MRLDSAFDLLKAVIKRWSEDSCQRMSAALAYYTVFSIAPLLLLTISIAGLVFGSDAVEGRIVTELGSLVGPSSAATIQSMIKAAYRPGGSVIASAVSIITLLIGAIGVVWELKSALNQIWRTAEPGGMKEIVKRNLVLLAMMLGIGFLLAVSLVISTTIAAVSEYFGNLLPARQAFLELANFVFSLAVVWVLFAAIYRILPSVEIDWRDVWIGGAVAALLFNLGKLALGYYLGRSAVASEYGAAGSVLIVLVWIYYSGLIFYFGAEFTAVYAARRGSRAATPLSAGTAPGDSRHQA